MILTQATNNFQKEKIEKLYLSAFPKCERKPIALIYAKQQSDQTDVLYLEEDSEFCGLAITMKDRDLILLDYFAIADNMRGRGIGSKALSALYQYYEGKRFFLEIESTLEDAPNKLQRLQRKDFYLKNGLTEIGIVADVFGTNMELLGHHISLTFEEYFSVYVNIYGAKRSGKMIKEVLQ